MYSLPRFGCLFCDKHFNDRLSLDFHHDSYLSEFTTTFMVPPSTYCVSSHPVAVIRYVRSKASRNPGYMNSVIVWNPITHGPSPGESWDIVVPIADHRQIVKFMSRRTLTAAEWHRVLRARPIPPTTFTGLNTAIEYPPEMRNENVYHLSVGDNARNVYIHRGGDDTHNGGIHVEYGKQGWRTEKEDEVDDVEDKADEVEDKQEEVGSHPLENVDVARVGLTNLYRAPDEVVRAISLSSYHGTPPPQAPPVKYIWGDFALPASALFQFAIAIEPQHPPFIIDITRSSTLAGVLHEIDEALIGPVLGIQIDGRKEMVTEEKLEMLKEATERVWVTLVFEQ